MKIQLISSGSINYKYQEYNFKDNCSYKLLDKDYMEK